VAVLIGLEKFSHLEDKIYRLIETCKSQRQQIDQLEKELQAARAEAGTFSEEKNHLNEQLERMMSERDEIRGKVETMLEALAIIDPEMAESVRK
jgi:uncharacterized coiled-coil DUF342 family protein